MLEFDNYNHASLICHAFYWGGNNSSSQTRGNAKSKILLLTTQGGFVQKSFYFIWSSTNIKDFQFCRAINGEKIQVKVCRNHVENHNYLCVKDIWFRTDNGQYNDVP